MRCIASATLPGCRTVVLADNRGAPLVDLDGLTIETILGWLAAGPESSILGWDITPFVNVWLSQLDPPKRLDVFASVRTRVGEHRILFVMGKFLEIWRGRRTYRLFDVSGFWPSHLTLDQVGQRWSVEGATTGQLTLFDLAVRQEWADQVEHDIATHTLARARTIEALMSRVLPALEAADIKPSRLHGVGAIGSRILREAGGNRWIARYRPDRQPVVSDSSASSGQATELLPLFMRAYYGGRIETTLAGSWRLPTYKYDLSSAYPWALSWLGPVGYEWEEVDEWRPSIDDRMSLWYARWDLGVGSLGPLPWRAHSGRIAYPLRGSGWYWWPEVRAALAAYGDSVHVLRGYVSPRSRRRPMLAQIARRYEQRIELEAEGNPVAEILKGGLAASYGRLAQKLGEEGQPGRWYNIALAGWVCSAVRARLIQAWAGQEGYVAAISTDGLLTTMPLEHITPVRELGGWKVEQWDRVNLVLPGIYRTVRELEDGRELVETAATGISGAVDFDDLLRELTYAGQVRVPARWFLPNILADLWPGRFEEQRCRWLDGRTTIDPYRIARKRDGAEQVRTLDWRTEWAAFPAYEKLGDADSAPFQGPPAWQPGGVDVYREAFNAAKPATR